MPLPPQPYLVVCCCAVAAAYEYLRMVEVEDPLPLEELVVGSYGPNIVFGPVEGRCLGIQLGQGPLVIPWVRDLGLLDSSGYIKRSLPTISGLKQLY